MLVLFETAAGYAIFKMLNEGALTESKNLYEDFSSPEKARNMLKLQHFEKFSDITEALAASTAMVEGKISKSLKRALKKCELQGELAVGEAKLGQAIKAKFDVQCVYNSSIQELMRCIKSQLDGLIAELSQKDNLAIMLGLSHSLSRYKLKFSPDKIDIMVTHAIGLLDDIDKEINNYMMRLREWFGWHFPELAKIVTDNEAYIKVVRLMRTRFNAVDIDFSDILPEHVEEQLKEAAEVSMGTEVAEEDVEAMMGLADQIIELTEYRKGLNEYLAARMMAIAPNLCVLAGELVGARLMAHAGSLVNLAKYPASTVQIIGAEKALFRALKTKKDTPKYGLIYHSALVGQASTRNKGKMSRMLAAKISLASRVDALGDDTNFELGAEHKARLEARLRLLEEGNNRRLSGTGKAKAKFEKYHGVSTIQQYPVAVDSTMPSKKRKKSFSDKDTKPLIEEIKEETFEEPIMQKKKKARKESLANEEKAEVKLEAKEETPKEKKKKNKQEMSSSEKKTKNMEAEISNEGVSEKKKKKKKNKEVVEAE